jgi:hypothetical protein
VATIGGPMRRTPPRDELSHEERAQRDRERAAAYAAFCAAPDHRLVVLPPAGSAPPVGERRPVLRGLSVTVLEE